MPGPCTPHAAAQLQPIHAFRLRRPARLAPWIFMIDRQRLALGGSVECGVVRINYVVTWTTNLWPFGLESGIRVTCYVGYLCVNFSLPRPLCCRLRPDVCDRQTDVRRASSLNAPAYKGRGIITDCRTTKTVVSCYLISHRSIGMNECD